jgi:electron-transferring-flavoprotein dehydrogenase
VIQTTALEELFPNWLENPPEPITPARKDRMRFLTKGSAIPIPAPPQMHNKGNYIMSLNNLTKWLAQKAEELGVEVYPGFAASEVLVISIFSLTLGAVYSGRSCERCCDK